MKKLLLILAFLFCVPAHAQNGNKQPAPNGDVVKSAVAEVVKGKAGRLLRIEIKAEGAIDWDVDERLTDKDFSYLDSAKKVLLIVPPAGGIYTITGAACDKSKPTLFKYRLEIEGGPPPGPVPVPIPDPLTTRLKTAFAVDAAAGKGTPKDIASLVTMIDAVVPYLDKNPPASTDQIKLVLDNTATAFLSGKLPSTLKAVNDYISEMIPEYLKPTPLTDSLRQKFKDAAAAVKQALAQIAPGPEPPSDQFTKTLQAAYDADTGADKASSLTVLRRAYAMIPPKLTTNQDALAWLKQQVGLDAGKLTAIRRAIATEFVVTMGTQPNVPLDAARFQAELTKISNALNGVK